MKRMGLWITMAAVFAIGYLPVASAENATGLVYNDANANGVLDAGEQGLADILVSNGADIVKTAADGRYTLPVTQDTVLFVIKPSGWMCPVDPATNLPRFYYLHKPNGSPALKYPGVAPTGPLPASIDFPLHQNEESSKFRVVCLGDTQTRNVEEVQFLAHDMLEDFIGTDAVFGITLGDNVFNDLSVFEPFVETMGRVGIPWRCVQGNHDHNHDASTTDQGDESFQRVIGPTYYTFNYASVHFIVLDDIRQEPSREDYHAGLGPQQLTFLENDLREVSPDKLIVLLMHIPISEIEERAQLYAMLEKFPNTVSLSAHTHTQEHEFIDRAQGWMQDTPHHHIIHGTACGSWWGGNFDDKGIPTAQMSDGCPNGYSYLDFDGVQFAMTYHAAHRPADDQMNIWVPEQIPTAETAQTQVIVNVFAGSSRSRVEMRLDGNGDWTPLEMYLGIDPYYAEAIERQNTFVSKIAELKGLDTPKAAREWTRNTFKSCLRGLPEPADDADLWRATLPANLTPGGHVIEVRTTDMYNHTSQAKRIFTVR